jgi:large subunit ribosomal protein L2
MFGKRNDSISLIDSKNIKYILNSGFVKKTYFNSRFFFKNFKNTNISSGFLLSDINSEINDKSLFFLQDVFINQDFNFNFYIPFNICVANLVEIYTILSLLHLNKLINYYLFLKKFKPTSNGVRHKHQISSYFMNSKPYNYLRVGFKKNSGRNLTGRITVNHKVNYTNRLYTNVDFKRNITNLGVIVLLHKNCGRSSFVSLVKFSKSAYSYILTPHGCLNGSIIQTIIKPELFSTNYHIGFTVILRNLQSRSIFFNVELNPGQGGVYARSAGNYCVLINNDLLSNTSKIKLPSSKIVTISSFCLVTLGRSSNIFKERVVIGNAGYNVRKGIRPSVRGVAMNPVDHPHGGRTKTNSPELTP